MNLRIIIGFFYTEIEIYENVRDNYHSPITGKMIAIKKIDELNEMVRYLTNLEKTLKMKGITND